LDTNRLAKNQNRYQSPKTATPCRFNLKTGQLLLNPGESEEIVQLDEMGVVVKS